MTMQNATTDVAAVIGVLLRDQERSARWLARRLEVSHAYVQRRLSGDVELSVSDLTRIAAALNTTVEALINGERAS